MIYVGARQLSANYVALVLRPVENGFYFTVKRRSIVFVVVVFVIVLCFRGGPSTLHSENSPFSTPVCSHRQWRPQNTNKAAIMTVRLLTLTQFTSRALG